MHKFTNFLLCILPAVARETYTMPMICSQYHIYAWLNDTKSQPPIWGSEWYRRSSSTNSPGQWPKSNHNSSAMCQCRRNRSYTNILSAIASIVLSQGAIVYLYCCNDWSILLLWREDAKNKDRYFLLEQIQRGTNASKRLNPSLV